MFDDIEVSAPEELSRLAVNRIPEKLLSQAEVQVVGYLLDWKHEP